MNCTEVRQNLEAVHDDAIEQANKDLIDLHLIACASCQARLARLRTLHGLLRQTNQELPSASLDDRVMRSFQQRYARTRTRGGKGLLLRSLRVPVPVLTLLLFVMLASVVAAYWAGKQNATSIIFAAPQPPSINSVPAPLAITEPIRAVNLLSRTTVRAKSTPFRPSRHEGLSAAASANGNQLLKSSTVIGAKSTSYSTVTALPGFEPLPDGNARIIKGARQK